MKRTAGVLVALLLLAGPARPQDAGRPAAPPIEEFLPADTALFAGFPNGRAALDLLGAAGLTADELAGRLAPANGDAAAAKGPLDALLAAARGPVSLAIVPERLPRRPVAWGRLVTLAAGTEDALPAAVDGFLRGVLAPLWFTEVREERLMELPVVHFVGKTRQLYVVKTRGLILVADGPILLGRVLKELQSPAGRTLARAPEFAALRDRAAGGAGLLYVDGAGLPDSFKPFGIGRFTASIARREGAATEDARILPAVYGLTTKLEDGPVPAVLSGSADALWFGARFSPMGALQLAFVSGGRAAATRLFNIDQVAAGPAEALIRDARQPLVRIELKDGVEPAAAAEGIAPVGVAAGEALLVSGDAAALAAPPAAGPATLPDATVAAAAGPSGLLVRLLGGRPADAAPAFAWRFARGEDGAIAVDVREGPGPAAVVLASLFR